MNNGLIINGKYEINEMIASGGMADIYLATELKSGKKFAVKILSASYSKNKGFIARFKKEAQILSKLSGHNIVSIYEYGEFEGTYYIVMEYVSGQTLKEIIEKKGYLSPSTAAGYAIQICRALKIAHFNGLIHRDIKPQNILITPEGLAKVADFGIAKYTSEELTRTLNVIGTAHYISPEHLQGRVLDQRSDIYSFGVVLFEMLTADLPFRGGGPIDIGFKHINEKPQRPSDIIAGIPERLDAIVLKCLEKRPERRYQNVANLISDLEDFLSGRDITAVETKKFSEKYMAPGVSGSRVAGMDGIAFRENLPAKLRARIRRITLTMTLLALIFAAGFTVILALFFNINSELADFKASSSVVEVPDLISTDFDSAEKILLTYGLNLKNNGNVSLDNLADSIITYQEPVSGTAVNKGSNVYVKVNKANDTDIVLMPNLIGLGLDKTEEILKSLNLRINDPVYEYNPFFENNMVFAQSPPSGQEINKNSQVDLTVSKGTELITVPDVRGMDYVSARLSIESLGLSTLAMKFTDVNVKPGTVLAAEPSEGSAVIANTLVKLYVATGEHLIIVPDLENMDAASAGQILSDLGINFDQIFIKVDYSIQKNTVISQIPESGDQISVDDRLLLFIGQ